MSVKTPSPPPLPEELAEMLARPAPAPYPRGRAGGAGHCRLPVLGGGRGPARRTLEWVGRGENVCICGPSGTGKSVFAEALGHLAIDQGKAVAWHTLESLAALLRGARADETVAKAIGKLIRADLVVIDDVGMVPGSTEAAEALFRVVDAAYEKRSLAITSNIHPSGFDELMPRTLAAGTVDRLLHHAHVIVTDGVESYRLSQATEGKGVVPLS
jgi:DNA replication protein DnaC